MSFPCVKKEGLSFTMQAQVQLCLPSGLARGLHKPEVPGWIPGLVYFLGWGLMCKLLISMP